MSNQRENPLRGGAGVRPPNFSVSMHLCRGALVD